MSTIVQKIEHFLALPFFGIGMKTDLFQSCGHCWVFQIFWHIECSTFTASSFRIWNSSTGIPSPPLALFVVMLPRAHLTSHSRMSGSRWVITPSWLSGSWRSFFGPYIRDSKRDTVVKNRLLRTLWEKVMVGRFERIALKHVYYHLWNRLPVDVWCMRQGAQGWCTGITLSMGREVGEGFKMGNTCTPMAESCQCRAKTTTIL